jgi:hypothetical protein
MIDEEELSFDEFLDKFNKNFPDFVLQPDEIYKFWAKNERRKCQHLGSLTPELDSKMDECMDKLEEVLDED